MSEPTVLAGQGTFVLSGATRWTGLVRPVGDALPPSRTHRSF
jgi:hypothetical protein